MLLTIRHTTTYDYDHPVPYALQQLRMTPKHHPSQKVLGWTTLVEGGHKELTFEDAHRNTVDLVSFSPGTRSIAVTSEGMVETAETHGIHGPHGGFMPLWMFLRQTPLTRAGVGVRKLVQAAGADDAVLRLHALMAALVATIVYEPGASHVGWTAEDTIAAGRGVCQDMTHAFIAAARAMGLPARYVSGYLMIPGQDRQDATHAWAEAHVEGLGWVGFDVANGISPDERYVRVATGLDYAEAAPVSGLRLGPGGERMSVAVAVRQVQQ